MSDSLQAGPGASPPGPKKLDEQDLFQVASEVAEAIGDDPFYNRTELHYRDLIKRARPLLKKLLSAPARRREELEELVPASLWLVYLDWRDDPQLDGREVPFREFVAARLKQKVLNLHREERPDLYNVHKKYLGETPLVPLDKMVGKDADTALGNVLLVQDDGTEPGVFDDGRRKAHEITGRPEPESSAAPDDPLERLAWYFNREGIAGASQEHYVAVVAQVDEGTIRSGYQMAKALNRPNPNDNRATSALLQTWELLERLEDARTFKL